MHRPVGCERRVYCAAWSASPFSRSWRARRRPSSAATPRGRHEHLAQSLRSTAITREDELTIRATLAEAWLLQDDIEQASAALGRPPDTLRETVPAVLLSHLWRLHGRVASARGEQSRGIALHGRALRHARAGARSARDRPRPLRAGALLQAARRHRHDAGALRAGGVGAARRRRSTQPRARALAVGQRAGADRAARRGAHRDAAGRAPRDCRPRRRRARDRLRQPGERRDDAASLRPGARARRAQRGAARAVPPGARAGRGARDARTDLHPPRGAAPRRSGAAARARSAAAAPLPRDDRRHLRLAGADPPDSRRPTSRRPSALRNARDAYGAYGEQTPPLVRLVAAAARGAALARGADCSTRAIARSRRDRRGAGRPAGGHAARPPDRRRSPARRRAARRRRSGGSR